MRARLSAAFLFLCASSALASVTGTIVREDGRAAAGARVVALAVEASDGQRARWLSADPVRKALASSVADSGGNFSIDAKGPVVDLRIEVAGLPAVSARVSANEDAGVLRVAAQPMARGTVRANGKPLPEATVIVSFGGAESITITDASGQYAVPDPKRLTSRILVRHPRHAPLERELGPMMTATPDVAMTSGAALAGRVVAADGRTPVASADIAVDNLPLATTAADGSFAIEHAPAAARKIVARSGDAIAAWQIGSERNVLLRLAASVTITGSVRDIAAGVPIAGAQVNAAPPRSGDTQHGTWTITDERGNYAISGLPGGEYELTVIHPSYGTPREVMNLRAGRAVRKVLYVAALARISGAVVDESSRGVAGASVEVRALGSGDGLWTPGLVRTAQGGFTAPNGRFVVRTADEGNVELDAAKAGMPAARSGIIRVAAGARTANVTITMARGVALTGRVTGREAKPVGGAAVAVMDMAGSAAGDAVRTNGDGKFSLRLGEGTYDVAVSASGYAARTVRAQVSADARPLEVALEPGVEVSGRVTRGGFPVEGVNVFLIGLLAGGGAGAPVQTAADGTFRVGDLAPGPVKLAFKKPADFIQTTRAVTAPAADVNVDLPAGGRVSGRVIDKATKEAVKAFDAGLSLSRPGAAVFLVAPAMRSFTSDDGTFAIDGVPVGTHILAVSAPGYVMARVPNVTVESGKSADDIEVALEAGVHVTGHVTGPDGAPAGGVLVRVDPTVATHGAAMNDPFTLTDPDGEYVLENVDPGQTTLAFSRSGLLTLRKNVTLSGTSAQVDAQLAAGASIVGVVVLESGTPVANAQVQAASASDAGSVKSTQTDESGTFAIAGVAAGHYQIIATRSGYASATLSDVGVPAPAALRLVMKGGGTIAGRLIGLAPADLRGASVQVWSSDGGGASASPDESGRYRVDGAPAGTVRVSARAGPLSTTSRSAPMRSVQVEAGLTVTVDFDFSGDIVISGRVTRSGVPQPGAVVSFIPAAATQRSARTTVDGGGRYEIAGVDSGGYTVFVLDPDRAPYSTPYQVDGTSTFDIDIRGATVAGRVIDGSTDSAIAGASVDLRRKDGNGLDTRSTLSDASGAFSFDDVAVGAFEARARKSSYGAAALPVVVGESSAPPIELRLTASSGLAIRIVDARDGRSLAGWYHAEGSGGERYDGAISGSADAEPIALGAGSYRITVGAAGYAPRGLMITAPAERTVTLTPGGAIVVASSSDGFAFVRLIDGAGLPVRLGPGLTADLFRVDPAPGRTRIANVAAGTYTLQLLVGGNVLRTMQVTVREGESVAANL